MLSDMEEDLKQHIAQIANYTQIQGSMPELLADALKKVLVDDEHSPILVKSRVQRICDDINSIKGDLRWIKYLGGGFLIAAGALALKALGIVHI